MNNIVDLTNDFTQTPTVHDLKIYIQKLMNNGIEYDTSDSDWKIDIRGGKEKINHIVKSSKYGKMNKSKLSRHYKYIASIEKLIKNAKYTNTKANSKSSKKPNIDAYHYFEINVIIKGKQYKVILNAEQYKGDGTTKPQTVHLYDVIEAK